jgi:hypothetical protein
MKLNFKWRPGSVIPAIICLFPAILPAAEPEPYDPGMDDESMLFMDIPSVYSASKYEQSASDAPAWVRAGRALHCMAPMPFSASSM